MRVSINADGREVSIDCDPVNVTVRDVAAEALGLWHATKPAEGGRGTEGSAYGFTQQFSGDRAVAGSQYHGRVAPVQAEGTAP